MKQMIDTVTLACGSTGHYSIYAVIMTCRTGNISRNRHTPNSVLLGLLTGSNRFLIGISLDCSFYLI